jgi:hypothetical protein
VDLVIDRMLELTIDEGVPVYVIPIRTPERIAKLRQEERTQRYPQPYHYLFLRRHHGEEPAPHC